jgi:GAF domain-containing protein
LWWYREFGKIHFAEAAARQRLFVSGLGGVGTRWTKTATARVSRLFARVFLNNMSGLFAQRLRRCRDLPSVLDCVLHHGLEITNAQRGDIQIVDSATGCLVIEAQSGLHEEFLRFFARIKVTEGSACARAIRQLGPIVIEDVWSDEEFKPYREIAGHEGFRAVVSIPLVSTAGTIGVLSTHFPAPHTPSDLQLDALIRTASLATNAIILRRALAQPIRHPRFDSAVEAAEALRAISESDHLIRKVDALLRKSDELLWQSRFAILRSKQLLHQRATMAMTSSGYARPSGHTTMRMTRQQTINS